MKISATTTLIQYIFRLYSVQSKKVKIGRRVHIGLWSALWAPNELIIEDDVYIGNLCTIQVDGRIGRFSMIANNVGIVGKLDHDYREVGKPIRFSKWVGDRNDPSLETLQVNIEEDVWVGYGASILSGLRIGRGAIIAAGSVVTHNVEPYAIVAGNPAKPIAKRFSSEEIIQHEKKIYPQGAD